MNKWEKLGVAGMVLVVLIVLAGWAAIGYVAYHFISKVW